MNENFAEEGLMLLVNKPLSWTSFDVVNKLRYALKVKKIGHAGTLDPLATGLLIVCTGKKTKEIDQYQGLEKEYVATFRFGNSTPSYDAETPFDQKFDFEHIDENFLRSKMKSFVGTIQQTPPAYSAIKINGKKMYELARKGKEIPIASREVNISVFELLKYELPAVDVKIVCSKGTYVRSLAHDLGKACGSGAYLSALCRTRIGKYELANAFEISDIVQHVNDGNFALLQQNI